MGVGREKKLLESLVGLTTTTILAEFNHTGRHHGPNVGRATCRGRLETQVSLEVLSDLTDQMLEGQLAADYWKRKSVLKS